MIVCPLYANLRSKYLPDYYFRYPNIQKFYDLMSCENEDINKKCINVHFVFF
jgi:hypothetical protein